MGMCFVEDFSGLNGLSSTIRNYTRFTTVQVEMDQKTKKEFIRGENIVTQVFKSTLVCRRRRFTYEAPELCVEKTQKPAKHREHGTGAK